jgi:DNA-binding MarR family transcriptional regulator
VAEHAPEEIVAGAAARPPGPLGGDYLPSERELLHAVRDLVAADRRMRRRAAHRMRMGENDLRAVRFVLAAERHGAPATPRDLADHLAITTAATTALLDRLVAAGHVQRAPHGADRRSKVVLATDHARAESARELVGVHERMRAAAAAVPESARPAVVAFLTELAAVMDDEPPDPARAR